MVKMMIIQWNWVYPTLRQTQWLCPSDRIMLLRILKLRTWCQCLHVGKRSEHSMFVIYLRKSCSTLLLLVDNSTRRCCFIRSQHCFDQSTIFAYIIWLSHVKSPQKACPVVASIQLLFVKSVLSASSKTDKVPKFFLVPSLFYACWNSHLCPLWINRQLLLVSSPLPNRFHWMNNPQCQGRSTGAGGLWRAPWWINGRWKLSTLFKPQKNAEWE